MVRRGARPLDTALAVETRVREPREERREPRHLVEDRGRPRVVELAADREPEPLRHALGELARDPPVGPRLARPREGLAHALDAPLRVGERALLLGERRRRQEDVGARGRLVQEEILHDEDVELLDRLLRVVEVGLREERVLADDVHGARLAVEAPFDHLGHDAPRPPRRPHAPVRLELRERLGVVLLVPGEVRRDAPGVAAPLDVVLAPQRGDAATGKAHLTRDECQVQDRVGVVDAVRVLRDTHAPDQAGARERRPRVPARGPRDVARAHGRHPLGVREREGLERGSPRLEPLRPVSDEVEVREAVVEDHARHRVEERHVGAGPLLEPEVRLVAQLDALGIDDDKPSAAGDGTAEADRDHRVVRGGVGADHQEAARFLVVLIGVRRGARAHRGEHRLDRRRVAEPRAVIHVVRLHDDATELLDHVAILVGGLGAREGAEPAAMLRQPLGGGVQRLVPAHPNPAALPPDHRVGDPVAGVDEARPEPSLDAEGAEARRVRRDVVRHEREPVVGLEQGARPPARLPRDDIDHEAAADAAVGAGRLHAAGDRRRRLLRRERPRRARRHALAARGADRRGQQVVAEDADLRRVTAPEERDGADLLNLVARDRAASAEDARLPVEHEERLRRVQVEAVQGREARLAEPVARGRLADLSEAVTRVLTRAELPPARLLRLPREHRECEVKDAAAHAHGVGVLGRDDHALARRQVARGGEPALALDADEARPAGAERRAIRVLAELGERDREQVHAVEDRRPLGKLDRASVDREPHRRLMIARTRPGTRRGPRGRRVAPPGRARTARRPGSPRRASSRARARRARRAP